MSNTIPLFLAPCDHQVDLASITRSLQDFLTQQKRSMALYTPIVGESGELLLANGKIDEFMENIITSYQQTATDVDFVIVTGLSLSGNKPYNAELNRLIAQALDAAIIFTTTCQADQIKLSSLNLQIGYSNYQHSMPSPRILGCMIDFKSSSTKDMPQDLLTFLRSHDKFFMSNQLPLLAVSSSLQTQYADASFWQILASTNAYEQRITPPVFRNQLIKSAQATQKKIVLPEGDEPRTLHAAVICTERKIAQCILLGNKEKIHSVAKQHNLELSDAITIIDPTTIYNKYVEPFVELRKNKGLTVEEATKQLQDPVVVGTMMLQLNEVDGLVSGAVHTTANTVRPALQIIKTVPSCKIVSSVFFVCLPEQVLLYADCAVNPNPTAEELADIAIQSSDTASTFNLPARIAMLSYSTGTSGFGPDVDKIKEATALVKTKRPDLMVEGPIQYDTAIDKEVARLKLPNSKIAGQATIFIFPDLNSGNICCKAVQRSTNTVLIGPMLQGLRKPVNDLSRGCLVDDIVFTIALTAVQANFKVI